MLIISKNVKLSDKEIAILSKDQTLISNVITPYGTDDAFISIEKLIEKVNGNQN